MLLSDIIHQNNKPRIHGKILHTITSIVTVPAAEY